VICCQEVAEPAPLVSTALLPRARGSSVTLFAFLRFQASSNNHGAITPFSNSLLLSQRIQGSKPIHRTALSLCNQIISTQIYIEVCLHIERQHSSSPLSDIKRPDHHEDSSDHCLIVTVVVLFDRSGRSVRIAASQIASHRPFRSSPF
jgi:hypothetical protein